MSEYVYKTKDGNVISEKEINFTGYEIKFYKKTVNSITEYSNGIFIGKINFRPTKNPIIYSVQYPPYEEYRYNNNQISKKQHYKNDMLNGECRTYHSNGKLYNINYYNNGKDITNEIIDLLKIKDNITNYILSKEEKFNIMVNYGSNFKFFEEYNIDSNYFDNIMKICLK